METLTRSLNYELPQELHFDKYAQHILENSRSPNLADTTTIALASSPSIQTFDTSSALNQQITTSEFLKKLGATFIHSIQLQSLPRTNNLDASSVQSFNNNMEMEFGPHHLIMNTENSHTAMDELQKQLDYDKFMNEVWIGVVLTLILISMIFCFCSCFLYHQFRMWKRNYRTTITQSSDVEAVKIDLDLEDPVPEYTLVSGLPSYETALELLHKNPKSCLIVHPSVFEVFNKNEKSQQENSETSNTTEACLPLLTDSVNDKSFLPSYNEATSPTTPQSLTYNHSLASLLSLATQSKSSASQCKSKSAASSPTSSETEKQFKA